MKRSESLQLRLNVVKDWAKLFEGKNISKIAKRADVSRATIYYILNGDRIPSAATINKIQKAIDESNIYKFYIKLVYSSK